MRAVQKKKKEKGRTKKSKRQEEVQVDPSKVRFVVMQTGEDWGGLGDIGED